MTVIASEIERFNRLSTTWWNSAGPMRPLHVVNALRLDYLRCRIEQHFGLAPGAPLTGLRILDLGCGGGLLSEPLARAGADVVGIDASAGNVAAARSPGRQGVPAGTSASMGPSGVSNDSSAVAPS